jgi:lipopolysaccharide/colanic/teichoic acid biosynthesis glycosyltransferase
LKRIVDLAFALPALIALSPVLMLIALAIWLSDFHSPLFIGKRVGRGGRPFGMIKFRTMRPDAWRTGVNSTAAGDQRITPIGRYLRRYKLDELPQLINVLIGDMSMVGPRPQVSTDAAMYTPEEQQMLRLRPGITDLASIVFSDEGDILGGSDDPDLLYNQIIRPWKSRLILLYLSRRSFWLDMKIIGWTALALVSLSRALERVVSQLQRFECDPVLVRMASRRQPLIAYPPPGADAVVERYPAQVARA